MDTSPIRVLLVDDSPLALAVLRRMLSRSPEIQVVGTARNGREALELVPRLRPAVICTDLHMPEMDGLELTQEVMARFPRPILVISVSVQEEDTQQVFQLLEAGAIDVFPKPRGGLKEEDQQAAQELIKKIKILSKVVTFTRHRRTAPAPASPYRRVRRFTLSAPPRLVAIGASTGGPQALQLILSQLPADFPVPILCIQHIMEGFLSSLVNWLASRCAVRVKIARAGEIPLPGTVYFPPEGFHLEIDHTGRLFPSSRPPFQGHRPSVTVTFNAVAAYYGQQAIGVLLTGMGKDGAEGMLAIARAGGITIAQDEESSVVFGMPKQAILLGAAHYVLPVSEIAPHLLAFCSPDRESRHSAFPLQTLPSLPVRPEDDRDE
ncbi:MAG: chemotaxis response regulator protein-glutamate methylesterase [Nitrospinota bacterium]|nr:MAG: chemotaxis response regulator protein-glutamate methylesterase [Nitrospinota bacterium]